MVIYFAKVNLNSDHIYRVYEEKIKLKDILSELYTNLHDGESYTKTVTSMKGMELIEEKTTYTIAIQEKDDYCIRGYLLKKAVVHVKKYNKETKELETRNVDSDEAIEFYFDVLNEMVGYTRANRLGYKMFIEAFQGIIDEVIDKYCKEKYKFTVENLTEGMDIEEIERELEKIGNIQTLNFRIQPPNADTALLKEINENAEATLNKFNEAKISSKSVILTSSSSLGLNIKSQEVKSQLKEIENIHSKLSTKEAIKKGYVEISAIDNLGRNHSTKAKKPVTKRISDMVEFLGACKEVIKLETKGGHDSDASKI